MASNERYYFSSTGWWPGYKTKKEWLTALLAYKNRIQPPDWWVIAQTKDGLKVSEANRLWYASPRERWYMLWDQAPIEDFIARGYYR